MSNPLLNKFDNQNNRYDVDYSNPNTLDAPTMFAEGEMTLNGTIGKTAFLLLLLVLSAFIAAPFASYPLIIGSAIAAFVAALVVSFKPTQAPILAPIYAILEGAFLGMISAIFAAKTDGIVFQAVGLTISTLFVMLLIYRSGLIPVTQKLRMIIAGATMGIMLMYVVVFILNLTTGYSAGFLHDGSWLAIGISLLIIGVAAFNFLLDFDTIETGIRSNAPKYMEWYASFGLLVTLAWLYFEFLRLLSMLSGD